MYIRIYISPGTPSFNSQLVTTGWRRLIGSPKLQIIFHKRAIKYRSLLRKMTYKDKGSYESLPTCTFAIQKHWRADFWEIFKGWQRYLRSYVCVAVQHTATHCNTLQHILCIFACNLSCSIFACNLSCRSLSIEEPQIIGFFCGRGKIKIIAGLFPQKSTQS